MYGIGSGAKIKVGMWLTSKIGRLQRDFQCLTCQPEGVTFSQIVNGDRFWVIL